MEADPAFYLIITVPILLLLLEGFFSGSEIAFLSLPPVKGKADAKTSFFLNHTERLLATTLLGTNLCVITNSAFLTYVLKEHFGINNELYTVLILSPLILIFGETIPKTIAKNRPYLFTQKVLPVFAVMYKILSPLSLPFIHLLRLLGQEGLTRELIVSREELPTLISSEEETDIKVEEKEIIKSILSLKQKRAKDVMKPIFKVRTLETKHTVKTAIETAKHTGYTRFPVYEEHIYNIKGIVNIFDLINAPLKDEVGKYINKRHSLFVPETETIWNVLKQMQSEKKTPIAIVVDEHGAATGLITVEDILEELVGEIADEYDLFAREQAEIQVLEDNTLVVPGDIRIEEVEKALGINLPKSDLYETVAGLIMYHLDRIPKKGEELTVGNVKFKVLECDEKQIKKVKVLLWKKN